MLHCITCKTIIPDGTRYHTTADGWAICLACQSPCGMDVQGIIYHDACPDGCHLVTPWEEVDANRRNWDAQSLDLPF